MTSQSELWGRGAYECTDLISGRGCDRFGQPRRGLPGLQGKATPAAAPRFSVIPESWPALISHSLFSHACHNLRVAISAKREHKTMKFRERELKQACQGLAARIWSAFCFSHCSLSSLCQSHLAKFSNIAPNLGKCLNTIKLSPAYLVGIQASMVMILIWKAKFRASCLR